MALQPSWPHGDLTGATTVRDPALRMIYSWVHPAPERMTFSIETPQQIDPPALCGAATAGQAQIRHVTIYDMAQSCQGLPKVNVAVLLCPTALKAARGTP